MWGNVIIIRMNIYMWTIRFATNTNNLLLLKSPLTLFQILSAQCPVQIDNAVCCTNTSVDINSTCWFTSSFGLSKYLSYQLTVAFEIRSETFSKINLDQPVGIFDNNLYCKAYRYFSATIQRCLLLTATSKINTKSCFHWLKKVP